MQMEAEHSLQAGRETCAMWAVLLWEGWVGFRVINAVDQPYGNTGEASGDATESGLGTARDKLS